MSTSDNEEIANTQPVSSNEGELDTAFIEDDAGTDVVDTPVTPTPPPSPPVKMTTTTPINIPKPTSPSLADLINASLERCPACGKI